MPFTPAHAAIVLPFVERNRKYFSGTALIMGSMAPDFEYFFKMSVNSIHSHTFWGLIYFNIPVTVFLAFCFHGVVKHNLVLNLPVWLQVKFLQLVDFDFAAYFRGHTATVLFSAWVGAALHVLWDAFTHNTGFFVQMIPFLETEIVLFAGIALPLYNLLQHISSLVGLVIIGFYIYSMKTTTAITYPPSAFYWMNLTAITFIVLALRFMIKSSDLSLINIIITTISGFCIALFILGLKKTERKSG